MSDPLGALAAGLPVEIGVENAGRRAELQLETLALADLKGRAAKPLNELGGGQADKPAAQLGDRHYW